MKSLVQILTEKYTPKLGKIGNLNRVKYIRHYTTAEGLAGMLYDGYIAPNESQGDIDWRRYELYGKEVVSFHDARYDPEWNDVNEANRIGSTMSTTKTLGIHMNDICACIEYDFTDLPNYIQEHCGLINILETYIKDFWFAWNECIGLANIVRRPDDIIMCAPDMVYDYFDDTKDQNKWLNSMFSFLQRLKGIRFTEEDCKDLLDYAIHRQTQKLINRLLKIGWEKGDEKNPIYLAYIELYKRISGEPIGTTFKSDFLNYIAKHISKTNKDKINVEIRFDTEIPLKYAKRIIIFDGITDYILSWGMSSDEENIEDMNNAIKDCGDKYNIERISEGEIAKKLR